MKDVNRFLWLGAGLLLGAAIGCLYLGQVRPALAANDRYEDYIMCTGTVYATSRGGRSRQASPCDGVWLLDYRNGKLLGTIIDRYEGKLYGWSEVDLVAEFGIAPKQNVHFLMTTGSVAYNQAALYVAETTTGKFGVYTMGPREDNAPGVHIRRHDMVSFRK